jgi:4-amino-4-deoxy-L-arabinose transferase-like glycosyltransferase
MANRSDMPPLLRHRYLVLLIAGIAIYGLGLGTRDLWYPDEPNTGEVAQAMFHSGDWVAPRLTDEIWVDYPPLLYWAGCTSSHLLGGVTAFSLRLPCALAAIALALATCLAGSRWFGARAGLWAGFTLLTFTQFWFNAVGYRPDMLFALFIGLGLLLYASAFGDGRPTWWPRIAAFGLLGLAVLTKGPLGVLLPGLVLFLWHAFRREWRALFALAPLGLLSFAIYLPWFVACAKAMGADNILHEFWAQNFQRFYSGSRGHEHPFHYYLIQTWADLAVWSPLLPFAIRWLCRGGGWRDRNVQLLLWWFGGMLVFLSVAVTKRQLYLLPAHAAAALMLAPWLAAVGRSDGQRTAPDGRPARWFLAVFAVALPIAGVFGLLASLLPGPLLARMPPEKLDDLLRATLLAERLPIAILSAVAVVGGLWLLRAWRAGDLPRSLAILAAVQVPLYLLVAALLLPALSPMRTYAPQGQWIREHIAPGETAFALFSPDNGPHKRSAFQYYAWPLKVVWAREGTSPADDPQERALQTVSDVDRFFARHPGSLCFVEQQFLKVFLANDGEAWRARIVEADLVVGGYHYAVIRGPRG